MLVSFHEGEVVEAGDYGHGLDYVKPRAVDAVFRSPEPPVEPVPRPLEQIQLVSAFAE
jgi:hypothetical protein